MEELTFSFYTVPCKNYMGCYRTFELQFVTILVLRPVFVLTVSDGDEPKCKCRSQGLSNLDCRESEYGEMVLLLGDVCASIHCALESQQSVSEAIRSLVRSVIEEQGMMAIG